MVGNIPMPKLVPESLASNPLIQPLNNTRNLRIPTTESRLWILDIQKPTYTPMISRIIKSILK